MTAHQWLGNLRALALVLGLFHFAAVGAAERLVAGPQGSPMSVEQALHKARDGDTIELLPGEYRAGDLLIENRRLTFKGVGKRPTIKGGDKTADSRALWLVRGGEVVLENLEFRGARAVDGEGAGVRMEGGHLVVRQCAFYDNEHGLHAVSAETAELEIEGSEFGLAPKVVGGLNHLLNVGRIGKLTVTGTRFQQGFEGHLLKTRARESVIKYNFIHDGLRGGASYEIDIANGGAATVIGNIIAQGADSQNPVVVAYGSEGRAWERNVLLLAHNTLINYKWTPAWFLRVFSDRLPANTEVLAVNNLLVGWGVFSLAASGHFEGNRHATLGMLRDAETYGFELAPGSSGRGSGIDPRNVDGHDLSPKAEFTWPSGIEELAGGRTQWTPGAYQR